MHQVEDMRCHFAVGPVGPFLAQRTSHVSNPDAARVGRIDMGMWDSREAFGSSPFDLDFPAETIGVGNAQTTFGSVDFNAW